MHRAYRRRTGLAALLGIAVLATSVGCGNSSSAEEPPPDPPRQFFGVVPQGPLTEHDFARMERGEIGTVRAFLPWAIVNPSPDDGFDFTTFDPIVLGAAEHGIEVLPFLYGTPTWVATELDDEQECEPDCGPYAPRSEAALDAWREFVSAAVERYGPNGELWKENPDVDPLPIRAWQIWNEMNSQSFYLPKPDVDAYAELLATADEAIHEHDPEAAVVLGGMFGTPLGGERPAYTAWDFLRRLYEDGAEDDFDAVASHPYAAKVEKVEYQLDLTHDEIVRAGDDAGIWVTEVGWASSGADVPLNRGPRGQAARLSEAFGLFIDRRLDWNIETVTWYAWRDTTEPICDWCEGAGLFGAESLEPKPSWEAFTDLTGGS